MTARIPALAASRILVMAVLAAASAEITMPRAAAQPAAPAIEPAPEAIAEPAVRTFGRLPDGREAHLFTLAAGGWQATVTDYGAILTGFRFPPPAGGPADSGVDVALGFDDLAGYVAKHPYFGATCGRIAGRVGGAAFELDG